MSPPRLAPLAALLLAGCVLPPAAPPNATFSHYHAPGFVWRGVARVLVMPIFNETPHPQVADEMRRSLHAELQQLGLFEVVSAPPDVSDRFARQVRESGRFDEKEVIDLARCAAADVVLVGTVSHYSPYLRPRIGLTVQALSPDLIQVAASVDGLWDANNLSVGDRARAYYARLKNCQEHVCDEVLGKWDDSYGSDLVLTSPHLFQRFVCSEAARVLVNDLALLAKFRPAAKKPYAPRPLLAGLSLGRCCPPAAAKAEDRPAEKKPADGDRPAEPKPPADGKPAGGAAAVRLASPPRAGYSSDAAGR